MTQAIVEVIYAGDAASLIRAQQDAANSGVESAAEMKAASEDANRSVSGSFSKMSGAVLGYVDNMFGTNFSKAAEKAKGEMDDVGNHSTSLVSKLTSFGGAAVIGMGVAAVGIGAYSVDLATKYQALTTNIAAWGGISDEAAGKITKAFLGTAGTTIYAADDIAKSYGSVVGQLTAIEGHTLNSSDAMTVMKAAMDLAEGSGESLGTATTALAGVMQTYKMSVGDAGKASDQLFSIAKGSGTSLGAVAQAVKQVHTQLGAMTPPLGQTGALLVDMVEHGMNGSRALRSLGTSMNALLKPSENLLNAQSQTNTAFAALPPSLQAIGKAYIDGTSTTKEVTAATGGLDRAQTVLWGNLTKAVGAADTAKLKLSQMGFSAFDAQGKFIGLKGVFTDLYGQIHNLSPQAQLARLAQDGLASSAAKLLPVIAAGPAAFDKAADSVMKAGAAHAAAAKQAQTLSHQVELVKTTVKDWITSLGTALLPVITKVIGKLTESVQWLLKNKEVLLPLAAVIGGVLVTAMSLWIAKQAEAFGSKMLSNVQSMASGFQQLAAKIGIGTSAEDAYGAAMARNNAAQDSLNMTIANTSAGAEEVATSYSEASAAADELAAAQESLDVAEDANPIGAIILAITVLIGVGIELKDHWKAIWKDIKAVAEDAWKFIDNDIVHPIEEGFDWVVKEIKAHWQGLLEILIAPFAPVLAVVLAFHNQIIHFFEDIPHYVEGVINDIVGFFTAMPGEIMSGLGDMVSTIFGPLRDAGTWVYTNVITPVVTWFTQLPHRIVSALGSIINTIFGPLLGAAAWINTNVIVPIVNWFKGLPGQILHAIGSLWDDGVNIVKGLWNGISSMGSWLWDKVTHFAKSFVSDAIKSFFSIFSPSKLMAGHGMNIALGLAQGILSGASAVSSASNTMAHAALSGVTGGGGIGIGAAASVVSGGSSGGGGNGAPITLVLSVDGQRFAQAILSPLQSVALRNQKTGGQFTINLG